MLSLVNTDCYKSPPVQTLALFAKLLTPAFEEMRESAHVRAAVLWVFEGRKRSAAADDGDVYTPRVSEFLWAKPRLSFVCARRY